MAQVTEGELNSIVKELNFEVESGAPGQKSGLATYRELKDFLAGEVQFWSKYNDPPLDTIRRHFGQIHNFVNSALGTDSGSARTHLVRAVQTLRQNLALSVYSGTPVAQYIASIDYKNNPKRAQGAGAYVLNQVRFQENPEKEYFYGVLSAALYTNPDLLNHFLTVDRTVFDRLRDEITLFQNRIEAAWTHTTGEFESWKTNSDNEIKGLLDGSRSRFDTSHAEWKSAFEQFQEESKEKIKEMEGLYLVKLRLDAPANYWEDLRDEYKIAGKWWTIGSGLLTGAVVGGIGYLLYNPPAALQQKEVTPGTIKAAILIAVALSIAGYLINLFVRLATSSIHLSRDARERLQLTHMFLSLVKEHAIEPKDRDIVLAALFSRADTGLLKHDGTPAMASPLAQLLDALKSK